MFDILFTHPDFLLINKHPNVSVHKDDGDTMLLQEVATQTGMVSSTWCIGWIR